MDKLKEIAKKAKRDKDILAVMVFGSYVRNEKYRDIDVCLFLNKENKNSLLFQKRLSYSAESDLDVHIFQQLPLYIRIRVLKEGRVLYCRDIDSLYNIALQTIREFAYFKPVYEGYLEAVKHG